MKRNIFKKLLPETDKVNLKKLLLNKRYVINLFNQLSDTFNMPKAIQHNSATETEINFDGRFNLSHMLQQASGCFKADINGIHFYLTISDPLDVIYTAGNKPTAYSHEKSKLLHELLKTYGYVRKEKTYAMDYLISINFTRHEKRTSKNEKLKDIITAMKLCNYEFRNK
jgi:hypothetical protein